MIFDRAKFCFSVASRVFEVDIARGASGLVKTDAGKPGLFEYMLVFGGPLVSAIDGQAFLAALAIMGGEMALGLGETQNIQQERGSFRFG